MAVASALKQLGPDFAPELVRQVFITDELRRRTHSQQLREENAYADIRERLVRDPDAMLPKLVELAMLYCGAPSGGISLYVPGHNQFVWHHLAGELAPFSGGSTPRHYSPCGVVLDTRSVVLVREPERIYTWLSEAGISLPECLLVPLYDGSPEPIGTLWVVSAGSEHFTDSHAVLLTELAEICRLGLQLSWSKEQLKEDLLDQKALMTTIEQKLRKLGGH